MIGIVRARPRAGGAGHPRKGETKPASSATRPPSSVIGRASGVTRPPSSVTRRATGETTRRTGETRPLRSPGPRQVRRARRTSPIARRWPDEKLPLTGGEPRKIAGQGPANARNLNRIATPLWPIAGRQRGSENTRPTMV